MAYKIGDEVTFDGMIFRCRQAHVSQIDWQPPLVYALWERIETSGAWSPQVVYAVGDEVMFQGQRWRCIQGHQAQPDREPLQSPPSGNVPHE